MSKKLDPKLLSEELKKFKLLSEYTFYVDKNIDEDDAEEMDDDSKTSNDPNSDQGPDGPDTGQAPDFKPDQAPDMGAADAAGNQTGNVPPAGAAPQGPALTPEPTEPPVDPTSSDVEVDVTQLVKSGEDAADAANSANQKTDALLSKFSELERKMSAMDSITNKIETLEKEIIKRNPTPVEKLEMRSLNSFPYSVKLTDYWNSVDGYDANGEPEKEEYVLTKDDVDTKFDPSIKKTFDVPEDYEEQDVD